jgi:peptidyl-prolyl cis-trans isomerase SurA
MRRRVRISVLCLGLAVAGSVRAQVAAPGPPLPAPAPVPNSLELDHVVAIVGSNVVLESDISQEIRLSALEPLQVLPGQNTSSNALRRLIDRILIMQQMKEQQQPTSTSAPEVRKALEDLRKQIPACEKNRCASDASWNDFLRSSDLTPEMIDERWSQRLAILRFIDLRFRSGIRVPPEEISAYYQKTLVPALAKNHQSAPSLTDVSSRIEEIILEQQVSGLFQDWLGSLRDQGNVRIVDEAFSRDLDTSDAQRNPSQ